MRAASAAARASRSSFRSSDRWSARSSVDLPDAPHRNAARSATRTTATTVNPILAVFAMCESPSKGEPRRDEDADHHECKPHLYGGANREPDPRGDSCTARAAQI